MARIHSASWCALVLGLVLAVSPAIAANFALLADRTYATQKGAWDVKVVDLNGDGKPEILAALFDHEWVAVFTNDGTGRFPAGYAQYPSNENAALEVSDLDGDGKLDFATANYNVSSVSVRRGTGQATFLAKTNYPTAVHPRDLVSADLDGDGFKDLAVACMAGAVTIVRGRGPAGFDPATITIPVAGVPRGIDAGDFDHDGRIDLVVVDHAGARALPLRNLGAFAFAQGTPVPAGGGANEVVARDFNLDGWLDLAVANEDGTLSVALNATGGTFLAPKLSPIGSYAQTIAAADFDGDGNLDLLTPSESDGIVTVTLGSANGTFGGVVEGRPNAGPTCAAAGDLDGDGRLDAVTGNYLAGTVTTLLGRRYAPGPAFHFSPIATIPCDVGGYDVEVGDLDRDGHPDAVAAIFDASEVEVFHNLGDGTGRLAPPVRYPGGQAVAVDVGDFTGDGWPDVASANYGQNTVSLRVNLGDGAFAPPIDLAVGSAPRDLAGADFDGDGFRDLAIGTATGTFLTCRGSAAGLGPPTLQFSSPGIFKGITTGDIDGDGRVDVAIVDSQNRRVLPMHNDDGGHFSPGVILSLGNLLSDVVLRDLDGDGDVDLATANEDRTVQVCLNSGGGQFPSARPYAIGYLAQTIDAADFDGNGLSDLVVPAYGDNRIQVLPNIGDGYFGSIVDGAVGFHPRAAACADFDGDGRTDVVCLDFGAGTLHVMRNILGPGAPAVEPYPCDGPRFAAPATPVQAIALDLDGDGRADLASVGEGTASVWRNGPAGARQDLAVGAHPQSIAAGDLTGDGRPDLVVANLDEHSVSVFKNGPAGTFAPVATLPVGAHPRFVVVTDLNRDGVPDIATANEGDGLRPPSVTILFNPPGSAWGGEGEPIDGESPMPDPPTIQPGSPPESPGPGRLDLPALDGAVMLAAGDVDGDGATDLVLNESGAHDVAIWVQTTPGRFAPAIRHPAGGSVWTAIGDLDGDGRAELAIADPDADLVRVLWNTPIDPFTTETDIPVDEDPRSVALGDLTYDGVPDIAYASSALGFFGYLRTEAFHDFRYWTRCVAGVGARSIALAPNEQEPHALDAYVANANDGTIFQYVGFSVVLCRTARTEAASSGSAPVFALGRPAPNPAVGPTTLHFSLATTGPARLEVFDVRGRLVRGLAEGTMSAGPHESTWDGTDADGVRVRPGVYFYRLTSEAGSRVERQVLLGGLRP